MEASRPYSFFQDIKSRELNGSRVRKRPFIDEPVLNLSETGAVAVEQDGRVCLPMAISFCKTSRNCGVFVLADEVGYLSLFDSRRSLKEDSSPSENREVWIISEWVAHKRVIFDVCWNKDDSKLLTASADQTIKVWDAQEKKCKAVLKSHTGGIVSFSTHPMNSDVVVSGSRDGSFALWDLRCNDASTSRSVTPKSNAFNCPMVNRNRAHGMRRKAVSVSITSVLYLKDEVSIATAGEGNNIVKFWDVRNLRAWFALAYPRPSTLPDPRARRLKGISSMSQDSNGVFLTAACRDSKIYLYNILQLDKGPVHSFAGCQINSFFNKAAISPDAAHILGGSGDAKGYIRQINKPEDDPIEINGHEREVTAVDWCANEAGKLATCSDDYTVRIWNMQRTI